MFLISADYNVTRSQETFVPPLRSFSFRFRAHPCRRPPSRRPLHPPDGGPPLPPRRRPPAFPLLPPPRSPHVTPDPRCRHARPPRNGPELPVGFTAIGCILFGFRNKGVQKSLLFGICDAVPNFSLKASNSPDNSTTVLFGERDDRCFPPPFDRLSSRIRSRWVMGGSQAWLCSGRGLVVDKSACGDQGPL